MEPAESWEIEDLGSSALEQILADVGLKDRLAELVPHSADAWTGHYPSLVSLPKFPGRATRLRICIATEDIVGPVRNGGIGTTYAALAELLAELDHDVTILYLKGHDIENGTIDHWIEHYAAINVRFVPVPNYASADRFQAGGDRWLHAAYNTLRYLIDHPMDVVHVSEWRGSGYFCLLAKRQGLAFQETLFIVKASSPWMWNRLYGSQPLVRLDDLLKVHAERRCMEYADVVISGSLHLLRWMASQGYQLPAERTFVQPNVATFDHLGALVSQGARPLGARVPIDEIVFFGRLEARKGLHIFIQAINRLIRQGKALPRVISFLGKPGARMAARPDEDVVDFIKSETAAWPVTVEFLTEFQQFDALKYLLGGNRLAVMPSVIENSSLAVYEAVACRIPFVATTSGGTPELVATSDHPHVLCEAYPIPLAGKIADALARGGYVARPSFDNSANLQQWRQFHLDLGRGLLQTLSPRPRGEAQSRLEVSVCIYHAETRDKLQHTLSSLKGQDRPPLEILVAVDNDREDGVDETEKLGAEAGLTVEVVPAFDLDAGQAFNRLADRCRGDYMLFLWAGATLRPMALRALSKVASSSDADLVNYFFRVTHEADSAIKDYLSALTFGSIAEAFFRTDMTALPLLVKSSAFGKLGGFSPDHRVLAHDHEFVTKAQMYGLRCETALLELGAVPAWDEQWLRTRCYDQTAARFRAIRPQLAAAPLALRELLLMAKGLQRVAGRFAVTKKEARARRQGAMAEQGRRLARVILSLPPGKIKPPAATLPMTAKQARRHAVPRGPGLIGLIEGPAGLTVEAGADSGATADGGPPLLPRARVGDVRRSRKATGIRPPDSTAWLSNVEGKRFAGEIVGVYEGSVYGWVRDEDRPQDPIDVEITIGDRSPWPMRADRALPTVLPGGVDLKNHGFIVPVWRKWRRIGWDWRSKRVTIRVRDADLSIAELEIPASPTRLEPAGYDGYCDITDATLRGWVWRPSDPHAAVDVAVFIDGKFFVRTAANSVRDDLRAAGIGTGAHGFGVPIPKHLRDGKPHSIDVVVADRGLFLKHGRLTLVGDTFVGRRSKPARTVTTR